MMMALLNFFHIFELLNLFINWNYKLFFEKVL